MARRRQQLIDRRKTVGLSQEQLAEVVGVERTTVGRWETGESSPQPTQRPRLAKALSVSLERLQELLLDITYVAAQEDSGVVLTARIVDQEPRLPRKSVAESEDQDGLVRRPVGLDVSVRQQESKPFGAAEWPVWFGVRTAQLVGAVDNWPGPDAQSDALQSLLDREFLMFDATKERPDSVHDISRRQALITIAALPLMIGSSSESLTTRATTELFLARCAASLTACWHLLRGSNLDAIENVLSAYLLKLETITKRTAAYRDTAARLASQGHRISGILALHRSQLRMREHHCRQALYYASATSDLSTRASALISLASTYFYDSKPTRAASILEHALAFESDLSPLQRSRVHAELAVVLGQLGREGDARRSADLAQELYPKFPEQDASYLYAEFTQASLALERGLSYLALAERFPDRSYPHSAADVFSRAEYVMGTAMPDRIRFEIINRRNQVVNASPLFLSSSSSFSAGVFHPSVSRGRPLSLSAISSKSS